MSLNGILRRASSFLGITSSDSPKQFYEDGDIVFCKNNVCVHTPSKYRAGGGDGGEKVHHPGYLVIKCVADVTLGTTLHLSWIPNERLRRNHDLISHVNMDASSRSNSPYPTSESESLSVSSLVLHDGTSTRSKASIDDGTTVSTSGISTLDIGSETKTENTGSPSSEESDSEKRKLNEGSDEGLESDKSLEDKSDPLALYDSIKSSPVECTLPECEQYGDINKKILASDYAANSEDTNDTIKDFNILQCNTLAKVLDFEHVDSAENIENDRYINDHVEQENEISINPVAKDVKPNDDTSKQTRKLLLTNEGSSNESKVASSELEVEKYLSVSSTDSSSDGEKIGDTFTITETTESSLPVEGDSLESSPEPNIPLRPSQSHYFSSNSVEQYWYERSAESMAYSANLAFPESSLSSFCPTPVDGGSSPIRREHKCGIFSIDVGQSKSLRLFFNDREHTCGQLVIASRESQYKIFHFHHGGLDKLASIFEDWNFLVKPREEEENKATDSALKLFLVCKPDVSESELHPEEGQHESVDADSWITYFSEEGVIEDDLALRRAIFFGGVESQLRANVWPFLLHYYDYRTTFLERQAIMEEKHKLYQKINTIRENMSGEENDWFIKNVQCTVEKDVVRTDRSNPCFAGKDNPNLIKMKRILLNFAVHNPIMGYTQGMSDILAPILAEVRNEADVFWCFTGLMSKTIFVTSPKDEDMEKNLSYLRELLRLMCPRFFNHMANQQDGMDLLFCHRWILLCFKREFPEDNALAMWEACWSNYQTDYFHLFLVVAIVSIYGNDVVDQNLRPDETLLYFTSLANHMDGLMVLKKARGLLHHYRSMSYLPCTLVGLCELCGPGMWDSGHVPVVACIGHDDNYVCPLDQQSQSSSTSDNTSARAS